MSTITPDNYSDEAPREESRQKAREYREKEMWRMMSPELKGRLEEWFQKRYGVNGCCFQKEANGRYEAIDAVRRDAQRGVWLDLCRAWEWGNKAEEE